MLQQVEYRVAGFQKWVDVLTNTNHPLTSVMKRQKLVPTTKAKLLVGLGYGVITLWLLLFTVWLLAGGTPMILFARVALGLLALPVSLILTYFLVVGLAGLVYTNTVERKRLEYCREYLQTYSGKVIVVAGSYGKTSMKELLLATLSAHCNVAATSGNGNTPSAHAAFIRSLEGNEDYLIFELGEGKPGDVRRFAEALRPDYAVVTGLAPNHLDQYDSIDALAQDMLSLRQYVPANALFFAGDSTILRAYVASSDSCYDEQGALSWQVQQVAVSTEGTHFRLVKGREKLDMKSHLLGRHQIAPIAFAVAFALYCGVPHQKAARAIETVFPYAHRMQPSTLSGAILIDDTYNGNLEGMLAGLRLLQDLKAERKIYITPGLVDQGAETQRVHRQIAEQIAATRPDWVVLMQNSATDIITSELQALGYGGKVTYQSDALRFYQNLSQFVRAGDIVMMQNDWTDNYH
jgi:UDP-N-acetylmuramyl pentapeptide synthase